MVSNIGLAAYMKMHGCPLVKYEDGKFHLESEKTLTQWKLEYSDSICLKRDQAIHDLRSYYGQESFLPETMHSNIRWTPNLALAAYVSVMDVPIIGFDADRKRFYFESEDDFPSWQVRYINSECSDHDKEVSLLREIVKTNKG